MTKHTPGPWAISPSYPNRVNDRSGSFVADTAYTWRDEGETHANARLIAAAPDMRAELEQALSCLRQYRDYGEAMRSIGRGFQATDNVGRTIDSVIVGIESAIAKAKAKGE